MAGDLRPPPWLSAGGSVAQEAYRPGWLRRGWLIVELLLLFIGLPLALKHAVHIERMPLFMVLQPVLLAFVIFLLWDRWFLLRRELTKGFKLIDLLSILAVFLIAGGMVAAYVQQAMPDRFLAFPTYRYETYERVMILYPLVSVITQELVYRTFFFHRYGVLFGDWRWAMVVLNGALFGFAHIVFDNNVAIFGTAIIGILLAYRYATTRSFWAVFIEHTLWGWLVFTVGLNKFFFTGISNMPAWHRLNEWIESVSRSLGL
ncbi:MAG: CPBP family intramembrane glutamic endopeptidase [Filomicrobium sp.]